jgi:hypothetical protein
MWDRKDQGIWEWAMTAVAQQRRPLPLAPALARPLRVRTRPRRPAAPLNAPTAASPMELQPLHI